MSSRFHEITPESLIDNTMAHFDVYAKVTDDTGYLLYAKAPYKWTLRELTELSRVAAFHMYIEDQDRGKFERYLGVYANRAKIDPSMAPKFRLQRLQDIGAHLIETFFLTEINAELLKELKTVATDIVDCLIEDPASVRQLQGLGSHDLYTYIHSVGVGTLTAVVAMTLGEKRREVLRDYALGGLLHDVGKKQIPLSVLNKSGPLREDEWEQMKAHPALGKAVLNDLELPQMVKDIVLLHHEKLDGSGYPFGLSKTDIPFHVQIATIADIYNALTTTRSYHTKRNTFEALMFMKHNLVGKISPDAFQALVNALTKDGKPV